MKKTFNWLGWLLIALYLVILIFWFGLALAKKKAIVTPKQVKWFFIVLHIVTFPALFIAYIIVGDPITHSVLFYTLAIWVVFAIFSPFVYLFALRLLLPPKKAHARMLNKTVFQTAMRSTNFRQGILFPVLTFEFDNGAKKGLLVSWKGYHSFQGGETGMLTYKDSGKHLFFVDFAKD